MSYRRIFYGQTPEEATAKAQAFAKSLEFMRQPSVSPATTTPARVVFMPDGTVDERQKPPYQAVVTYYGLD
jgi:hypothetical protein